MVREIPDTRRQKQTAFEDVGGHTSGLSSQQLQTPSDDQKGYLTKAMSTQVY